MDVSSPASADGTVPVLVITGFLGAGKTTLLRNLLDDADMAALHPAVVVNEFGKVGLDGAQLPSGDFARFEIQSGSIFCTCTRAALLRAFTEMTVEPRPGIVLVEATGLAEPRDIVALLDLPGLRDRFASLGTVCVVDPTVFPRILQTLRAARVQVEAASVVVMNKIDLATPEQIQESRELVRALNPGVPVLAVEYGRVSFAELKKHLRGAGRGGDEAAGEARVPGSVTARTVTMEQPADVQRLRECLDGVAGRLLRVKGVVRGREGRWWYVEVEGGRTRRRPASAGEIRRAGNHEGVVNLIGSPEQVERAVSALASIQRDGESAPADGDGSI